MSELIWISDWQIQCCGEEFAVGDEVTWLVFAGDQSARNWAVEMSDEVGESITGTYDSHDDDQPEMTGVVRRIRTLSRAEIGPPVLDDVTAIEKWLGIHDAERTFHGWLVDLDPTRG